MSEQTASSCAHASGESHFVIPQPLSSRISGHLERIYPDAVRRDSAMAELSSVLVKYLSKHALAKTSRWSEQDTLLITYGDQVRKSDEAPLVTLGRFLSETGADKGLNCVHILPFYPYTSDDGFSVSDFYAVDPELGTWDDVKELAKSFRLMFDYVVNHASSQNEWFKKFLECDPNYRNFFIAADPSLDYSQVTRPRSTPLLTPYETKEGIKHVWTTFSADQVDMNFGEPKVLATMIDILLFYIKQGAEIMRLDALNYLWKEIGTACSHLPQTHEIVKLMRTVVDAVAPHTILISEANVPHHENISYFGDRDEAHVVYNFSLPPLLAEAIISERGDLLTNWARGINETEPDTTFLNFSASHDGIGVRSFIAYHEQGVVPKDRFDRLFAAVERQGGKVSTRTRPDGTNGPYELNISFFALLADRGSDSSTPLTNDLHVERFVTSQAIVCGLRGIPAIYFHSLIGTPNYVEGMKQTGMNRTINRRKFEWEELTSLTRDEAGVHGTVLKRMIELLSVRRSLAAFHPEAAQSVLDCGPEWLVLKRGEGDTAVYCVSNVTGANCKVNLAQVCADAPSKLKDVLGNKAVVASNSVECAPYQTRWLVAG